MDALKFIEEINRMCQSYPDCDDCPLGEKNCDLLRLCTDDEIKATLFTVEKWSKEHSHKTRQSVFLEQFPNVRLDTNGIIYISPCRVDPKQYPFNGNNCCKFRSCGECRREFWTQEV